MKYDLLVNKDHPLDENYIPENMVEYNAFKSKKIDNNHKVLVERECYVNYLRLFNDALKNGYFLIVDSSYRSYDYQTKIFDYYSEKFGVDYAFKYAALPGNSEHQTGLAIDFAIIRNGEYIDEFTGDQEEFNWLEENAYKYGFILRYPEGYEDVTGINYEPWHYRYVGKEIAMYMRDNIIPTFEDYHKLKKTR